MIKPLFNLVHSLLFDRAARTDAEAGVSGSDRQLKKTFGANPKALAQGSLTHTEAVQTLADRSTIRTLEQQLRELEALRATIGTPAPLTLQLYVLGICEFFGVLKLLKDHGLSADERVLPALGLTLALMFLTKRAFAGQPPHTPSVTSTPESDTNIAKDFPRLAKGLLVPLGYTLLVSAIALVRVGAHGEGTDASDAQTFADAILTIAITAGPAWLAANVAQKRGPAIELAEHISRTKRDLRRAIRREEKARAYLARLDADAAKHTDATTRAAAAYSLAHDRAQGGGETN